MHSLIACHLCVRCFAGFIRHADVLYALLPGWPLHELTMSPQLPAPQAPQRAMIQSSSLQQVTIDHHIPAQHTCQLQ